MAAVVLSAGTAFITYMVYQKLKDAPFRFITQTDHKICGWINGSLCSRISSALIVSILYFIYLYATQLISIPVENALRGPLLQGLYGLGIGAGVAFLILLVNVAAGFVDLKSFDAKKLKLLPIIFFGMVLTGFTEELLFRAIPINALRSYVPDNILVVGTALLFGGVHLQYSVYYGLAATVAGLLLGYGFLRHGFFWATGFHAAFNTIETSFYTVMKYRVKNTFMAGERKTPDDDGITTSLMECILLVVLKYVGYL